MTTLSPPNLGSNQIEALSALKSNAKGLTAPALRDSIGLPANDYGTRRAHAILARLSELGFVLKEQMSEKVALTYAHEGTGRKAKHRFKVTSEGKKALKQST